jgi:ribonuclease Z
MKLLLLGTAGYHPSARRHTACLMLPEIGLVLDAGTGFFRVRDWLKTSELDIFLTHAHLDHVVGLTYLFSTVHETCLQRARVHGAADHLRGVQEHLFSDELFPAMPPVSFHSLDGPVSIGEGGTLSCFPLVHPGGSLGYRLDWPGRSMAYVTDTTAHPDASYVEKIRGVDLLVHECNFPDRDKDFAEKTGHSCLSAVLANAEAARVKRLVLTHFSPLAFDDDPVGLEFAPTPTLPVSLGYDLQEIDF